MEIKVYNGGPLNPHSAVLESNPFPVEDLRRAFDDMANRERERTLRMFTGAEGMRQFQQAMDREVARMGNIEPMTIRESIEPEVLEPYTVIINGETFNIDSTEERMQRWFDEQTEGQVMSYHRSPGNNPQPMTINLGTDWMPNLNSELIERNEVVPYVVGLDPTTYIPRIQLIDPTRPMIYGTVGEIDLPSDDPLYTTQEFTRDVELSEEDRIEIENLRRLVNGNDF